MYLNITHNDTDWALDPPPPILIENYAIKIMYGIWINIFFLFSDVLKQQ